MGEGIALGYGGLHHARDLAGTGVIDWAATRAGGGAFGRDTHISIDQFVRDALRVAGGESWMGDFGGGFSGGVRSAGGFERAEVARIAATGAGTDDGGGGTGDVCAGRVSG